MPMTDKDIRQLFELDGAVIKWREVPVATVSRTALDTKALKEAMGEDALKPYMKTTEATVVTIKPMEG